MVRVETEDLAKIDTHGLGESFRVSLADLVDDEMIEVFDDPAQGIFGQLPGLEANLHTMMEEFFGIGDHEDLVSYFNFKHSFFIPEVMDPNDELHKKVASCIKEDLESKKGLKITKNDVIFVCSDPNDNISQ